MTRRNVVFGFLGIDLDRGKGRDRWQRWRPTIGLCQQDDFICHELVLIHEPRSRGQANQLVEDIAAASPETTVTCQPMGFTDPWDLQEVFGKLHDFASERTFDLTKEDYFVHISTGTHVAQICWFLLTESRHFPARLLQTSPGGGDPKHAGSVHFIDLDLSRYDRIAQRFAGEHDDGVRLLKSGIATRNKAFNQQIDDIETVAMVSDAPMLLMGPTGAGKSRLAARIFELKQKRHQLSGPFVEVNCATLRGDAAMSALFGHVKGAFTGAVQARKGLLSTADGGLLFLDEIGELGLDEQAMLLRALEERRFLPVGSDREVESEFQLIAGTNCDLRERVAAATFREDLLARINLWTYTLPGLRNRIEDLPPNVDYELERFAHSSGRRVRFSSQARASYLEFATGPLGLWRGNFRDLNASITRLCTLARGGRITEANVQKEIARLSTDWREMSPTESNRDDQTLLESTLDEGALEEIDLFDRAQLATVIRVCRTSKTLSAAGRTLFAASRAKKSSRNDADRLRKYLARFNLEFDACQPSNDS